jgi:O-acetyl-ADP-ribose deacetylase (regulator of RNase III)
MIEEHVGDLLAIGRGIIVHGCNARGRMGSGIALSIKHTFPLAYQAYQQQYRQSGLHLGDISVARVGDQKYVVNAVTQEEYGRDPDRVYVDYDAVRQCFTKVNVLARELGLPVHFPLIGCGLAHGDWHIVSRIIDETLDPDIPRHLWVRAEADGRNAHSSGLSDEASNANPV